MSRIDELKAKMSGKGFYALNQEEQKEYQELNKSKPEKELKVGGKVEVSAEQFNSLISRVKQLEEEKLLQESERSQALGMWQISSDKFPQKKAKLRVYINEKGESQYIINFQGQRNGCRWNAESQRMEDWYDVDVLSQVNEDGSFITEKVPLEISTWAKLEQSDWLDCTVIKEEVKERYVGESERAKEYDFANYRSAAGDVVPQFEKTIVQLVEVQLPNGKKIKVNANILNS